MIIMVKPLVFFLKLYEYADIHVMLSVPIKILNFQTLTNFTVNTLKIQTTWSYHGVKLQMMQME